MSAPAQLAVLYQHPDQSLDLSGFALAPGLREFFGAAASQVSPQWLASLRATAVPDPWHHGFFIVQCARGEVIGTAGFKGPPDADGVVEIAYGIVPTHQGQGYATEAAGALVRFAAADPRVRLVRAHTLPEANASTHVLRKCGFVHIGEVVDPDDGLVWRWERAAPHIGVP